MGAPLDPPLWYSRCKGSVWDWRSGKSMLSGVLLHNRSSFVGTATVTKISRRYLHHSTIPGFGSCTTLYRLSTTSNRTLPSTECYHARIGRLFSLILSSPLHQSRTLQT